MNTIKHTITIMLSLLMVIGLMTPGTAADKGDDSSDDYEEWQTESDNYSEDEVTVTIVLEGLETAEIRIADSEIWESVADGDSVKAVRSDSIEIKGKEGYWISAAYGETRSEAEESPAATMSETEGADTSVGVDNDGYVYIRAASSQNTASGNAAQGTEDQEGNVSWDKVSNAQAEAGAEKPTSVYVKGQQFYGMATAVSRVLRNGGSTITFRHDTGWIKNETKVKTITAVCISGRSRGLAYVGAVFNYVATIKEVSGNEYKIEVVYYPRKNKPNTWYNGVMASKAQIMARTLWVSQYVHTGYVRVQKSAGPSSTDFLGECPINYTLGGAKYYLYTDSSCTQRAKDTDGVDIVLTTDKSGATNIVEVELGGSSRTFWAKEVFASKGYKHDTTVQSVVVSTDNSESHPAVIRSSEPPSMGMPDFKVYKLDPSGRYGWNKLIGAEYEISYYDVTAKTDIGSAAPKRRWIFSTRKIEGDTPKDGYHAGIDWKTDNVLPGSDAFYLENEKRIIPCGWFTIREVKAPSGLALDDTVTYGKVFQPSNGASAEVVIEGVNNSNIEVVVQDAPQAVKLIIDKKDASTGKNIARENVSDHSSTRLARFASLAGAEYEVYYDDNDLSAPELVGKIITDENGHGELETRTLGDKRFIGDKLALGSYMIREVKAPRGYVRDKFVLSKDTQKVRDDGTIEVKCMYDDNGRAVLKTIKGNYGSGSHMFRTRAETENTGVFNYSVSSPEEPIRTYIRKIDAATSKELPGASLQIISDNEEDRGTIVEQWVSTSQEHLVWALPEGRYILREISAPYGYDIAEDIRFEIKADVIINRIEMKNKPVTLSTSATDALSDTHHGFFSDEEYIRDIILITGLYKGREYTVSGKLVDKATGKAIKDCEGNDAISEKSFTASGDSMEVEMVFKPDTSSFTSETAAVVFEKLYRKTNEEKLVEIAKHEDLNAETQTVYYGGIVKTSAKDKKSDTQTLTSKRKATVIDSVEFSGLSPEETYTVEGEIYDKTDEKLTDITSSMEMKPVTADGTTELAFRFDAREYQGHDLVVYETLKLNGRVISVHADPDNKSQTVHITNGKSPETGENNEILKWICAMAVAGIALTIMVMKRFTYK